ncbi:MAG: sigma-70 family RNA polymerase sigma factor [Chloroflexota bacterium]
MSIVLSLKASTPSTEAIDWNAQYKEHIGRVFNFFRYRTGNDQVAQDLTATVFEKAWKRRNQFRGDEQVFVGWLYAIARNVANDYFRKQPLLVAIESVSEVAAAENVSDTVAQQIEFGRLVHFIQRLPEREREIITLKYGADLTNRQIAQQLSLSESNVGSILHRTIRKLRAQMEQAP